MKILYPKLVCFGYHFLENFPFSYQINSSKNLTFSDLHHSTKFLNLSTPDDLLAEVAIGPLSAQETGMQQKTFV